MRNITDITGRLGNQMFQWAYLYAQFRDNKIPDYYLQDAKYFEKYKDAIKEIYGQGIGSINYVGIHVRRGDYVGGTYHTNLFEKGYYERAMNLFMPGIESMNYPRFMVFSDDIPWCKKQAIFKDCIFAGGNEIDDMNLLASCKGIIMANSSFSWWASYLSKARVVAPKEDTWFTDGVIRTKLLPEWEQI